MAWLKAMWAQSKWVILAAGGVLAGVTVSVLGVILRGLTSCNEGRSGSTALPVNEKIQKRVEVAEEQALVTRIEAKVRAAGDREQLERIAKVEDGPERRRRLAAMLRRL